MKRIMVIGVSAGVGKSTFARKLGETLHIPVYHLDALFWKPGWKESSLDEFAAAQREVVIKDHWIIDGNYSNTFDVRAERADTIVYLELPLMLCLYRVLKRWCTNWGKSRPDMAENCTEKLDWEFVKFICKTYHRRRNNLDERIHRLQAVGSQKTVVKLRTKREIQRYLDQSSRFAAQEVDA